MQKVRWWKIYFKYIIFFRLKRNNKVFKMLFQLDLIMKKKRKNWKDVCNKNSSLWNSLITWNRCWELSHRPWASQPSQNWSPKIERKDKWSAQYCHQGQLIIQAGIEAEDQNHIGPESKEHWNVCKLLATTAWLVDF